MNVTTQNPRKNENGTMAGILAVILGNKVHLTAENPRKVQVNKCLFVNLLIEVMFL